MLALAFRSRFTQLFMPEFPRPDGRQPDEMRPLSFETGIAPYATASVLVSFGDTRVICAATIEKKVPRWMQAQKVSGGWISAEYSMLPYSTLERKQRDISRGKQDGRAIEIQRLIGRSIRAVVDLEKLPGLTLWLDCDVLQADGGTRTASISGAYVAARRATDRLIADGVIPLSPFNDAVAAVSAGVFFDTPVLDLNYTEDSQASVDANVVMTGGGRLVEVQSAGEEATFSEQDLQEMLRLAKLGIAQIRTAQDAAIAAP